VGDTLFFSTCRSAFALCSHGIPFADAVGGRLMSLDMNAAEEPQNDEDDQDEAGR
jgi:hypothetical protein